MQALCSTPELLSSACEPLFCVLVCCARLRAGYGDMYLLIRNMVAANYDGSIILDHTPSFEEFAGGKYS